MPLQASPVQATGNFPPAFVLKIEAANKLRTVHTFRLTADDECAKTSHMNLNPLNQNELEVLRILWDGGELKPADVQSRFARPIENATLRSVLVNLVAKKHAHRRRQGKAFFYSARVPKVTMLQAMMGELARAFTGGSHTALVAHLVQTGDIKTSDLKILHAAAAGNSTGKSKIKKS